MEILYVRRFDFIVSGGTIVLCSYLVSKNLMVVTITTIIVLLIICLEWNKKIVFEKEFVFFKDRMFKKGIFISYSTLQKVKISKVYSTTFYDMIFTFHFCINGKRIISKLNLYDTTTAVRLIHLLKNHNIPYTYGDDLIEMILEHRVNSKT